MSPADVVHKIKLELSGLKDCGVLTDRSYAAALRYVASNESELVEMQTYSSISDIADTVVSIAGSCKNGKCE
jgi:hypothetical protein